MSGTRVSVAVEFRRASLPAGCVWWRSAGTYGTGSTYRDVEELLTERGIEVDHVTIFRWVQRFTPLLIEAARLCRHTPGDRWFVEEISVTISGWWICLYRAIDQFGQVIDVLVAEKRDLAATRRFVTRALG